MSTYKIEDWEVAKIKEAIRVSINTQYGTNGLMTEEEIHEKIKLTPETALIRMLKEARQILEKLPEIL